MIRVAFFNFLMLCTVSGFDDDLWLPRFSWDGERSSEGGIPHLVIHFPDGTSDVALLHPYNPIMVTANERAADIDPCIYMGHLMTESEVSVALTGGCPFHDTFDISFASARLYKEIFRVKNGEVTFRDVPFHTHDSAKDGVLPPADYINSTSRTRAYEANRLDLPSAGFKMKLVILSDASHRKQFGSESLNVIRRSTTHAQNFFHHPSLKTKITLEVTSHKEINDSIKATASFVSKMSRKIRWKNIDANVFCCYDDNKSGTVGFAPIGMVCDSNRFKKVAITEWYQSDTTAGAIMAHELGHILGMKHDFNQGPDKKKVPRCDSKGRLCSDVGGLLDYAVTLTKWSTCSVEDLTKYFNDHQPFCLETN